MSEPCDSIQISCLRLLSNSLDSQGGAIKETATGRNSFRWLTRDSYGNSPTDKLSSALLALEEQCYLPGITSSGAPRVGAMSSIPMPLGIVGDLNIMSEQKHQQIGYARWGLVSISWRNLFNWKCHERGILVHAHHFVEEPCFEDLQSFDDVLSLIECQRLSYVPLISVSFGHVAMIFLY